MQFEGKIARLQDKADFALTGNVLFLALHPHFHTAWRSSGKGKRQCLFRQGEKTSVKTRGGNG